MQVIFFIFGTIIGSFLNVIIARIPKGESIISPPSHCPGCGHRITPLENIPIFSYLLLKGKCRGCGEKIPKRYFIVEVLTGVLFLFAFKYTGVSLKLLPVLFMISVLVGVSFIDVENKIIPNKIIYPSFLIGLALVLISSGFHGLTQALLGFFVGGLILLGIAVAKPHGMGLGDVKLAAFTGLFFGLKILIVLFLSFLVGSVVSVILLILKLKTRKDVIPFGQFIGIAAVTVVFWGDKILDAYLALFGIGGK
jgi:leader peptidase (prepilin peptidase)/N-methyltransferase